MHNGMIILTFNFKSRTVVYQSVCKDVQDGTFRLSLVMEPTQQLWRLKQTKKQQNSLSFSFPALEMSASSKLKAMKLAETYPKMELI
jgi:hypothetical protein